jgi:phenylacetate-CoA ligase
MRSIYTRIASGILFPLHERVKGHDSTARRRALERSQWWPRERLAEDQRARLRGFFMRIDERVPYYRDLFRRIGVDPRADAMSVLGALPLLTKPLIRGHGEQLIARDHGPLTRYNTGGSSGEPLIFYMGRDRKSHDVAAKWRATRWWGVDIGDRELVVWGSPIELTSQDRVKKVRDSVLRSTLLPAFEMSPANLDRFVETIRTVRPSMLFGYPSSLALIAKHASDRGVELSDVGIKVAFVTSERLYPDQRHTISTVFGCPVANGYGARDAGFIAHECPAGNLHLSAEDIVVETVREDGTATSSGEAGEIVVTHMATAEFPFVRYRTGDVGVLSDRLCDCGRTLPILAEVQGRTTDFVVARDGTIMHGLALIYTLRDLPGVQKFRIVQQSLDLTEVQVVGDESFREEQEARIVDDFKARLGKDVKVAVQRVPDILPEASGKFRYVTSKLTATRAADRECHADP